MAKQFTYSVGFARHAKRRGAVDTFLADLVPLGHLFEQVGAFIIDGSIRLLGDIQQMDGA